MRFQPLDKPFKLEAAHPLGQILRHHSGGKSFDMDGLRVQDFLANVRLISSGPDIPKAWADERPRRVQLMTAHAGEVIDQLFRRSIPHRGYSWLGRWRFPTSVRCTL